MSEELKCTIVITGAADSDQVEFKVDFEPHIEGEQAHLWNDNGATILSKQLLAAASEVFKKREEGE